MCFYWSSVCLTLPNKMLLIPWEEGMGSGKNLYIHSWVNEVHLPSLHSSLFLKWIPKGGHPLVSQGHLASWKCTSWTRFLLLPFWSHKKDKWAKKTVMRNGPKQAETRQTHRRDQVASGRKVGFPILVDMRASWMPLGVLIFIPRDLWVPTIAPFPFDVGLCSYSLEKDNRVPKRVW